MACVVAWEPEDVALWLEQCLQLPYGTAFREAGIDGLALVELDEHRLQELGVKQSPHLLRLLSHITVFRTQLGQSMINVKEHDLIPTVHEEPTTAKTSILGPPSSTTAFGLTPQSSAETAMPPMPAQFLTSDSSATDSDGGSTGQPMYPGSYRRLPGGDAARADLDASSGLSHDASLHWANGATQRSHPERSQVLLGSNSVRHSSSAGGQARVATERRSLSARSTYGQQVPRTTRIECWVEHQTAAAKPQEPMLSARSSGALLSARSSSQRSAASRLSSARLAEMVNSEFGRDTRGPLISSTPRKLSADRCTRTPGPACYSPNTAAVRGSSRSGTTFPKASRPTVANLHLVGQSAPGAKYNVAHPERPPQGGQIGCAARWKRDSSLPQRVPEASPGPMQYTPRHSYSSRFK